MSAAPDAGARPSSGRDPDAEPEHATEIVSPASADPAGDRPADPAGDRPADPAVQPATGEVPDAGAGSAPAEAAGSEAAAAPVTGQPGSVKPPAFVPPPPPRAGQRSRLDGARASLDGARASLDGARASLGLARASFEELLDRRPEVGVGVGFSGGFLLATILRRLGR